MNTFRQVLAEYLNCHEAAKANTWINSQPCGPSRKAWFMDEVIDAFSADPSKDWDYHDAQDFIDGCRRGYSG